MTTRSGYFFAASKSAGLCRTPSIAAPSWLFQETTSSVLAAQLRVCALKSVSLRASVNPEPAVNTSLIAVASDERYAIFEPSRVKLKLDWTALPGAPTRAAVFVAGSSRNRPADVFCEAEKNRPARLQSAIDGSSSNDAVSGVGAPPDAGTVAMTRFV